jgi:hypothetical protein
MGGDGLITTLFGGMMVAEFAQDDRSHGGLFGGRGSLPIDAKTLIANAALNIMARVGHFE